MKNTLLLLVLLLSICWMPNGETREGFVVRGELAHEGPVMALYTDLGRMELKSLNKNIGECFDGTYEVEKEGLSIGVFNLLKMIDCKDKREEISLEQLTDGNKMDLTDTKGNFCPLNYEPVCGLVTKLVCVEDGGCHKEYFPKTFSNLCFLKLGGASKLYAGICEELVKNARSLGIKTFNTPDLEWK